MITGRNLPTDYQGKLKSTYEGFSRFEFVGISDEERTSLIKDKYPERFERIQRDKRLWDVLRIPMFMGMFLQINDDTTSVVHTRGEILEQFITKIEVAAADQIAKQQLNNNSPEKSNNPAVRRFIVNFSLPFVANKMDTSRVFSESKHAVISQITNGNAIYLVSTVGHNKKPVYESYTQKIINADSFGFSLGKYTKLLLNTDLNYSKEQVMQCFISSDDIIQILRNETGYCYDTSDGGIAFTHQYFRDFFAAKHIQNILNVAQSLGKNGLSKDEQLQFTKDNGLDYTWSDEVCIMLGEIIGDYKNEPEYSEE